jgi:NRAMP (natural resistance-associated macrophage protein)-like metal ion transporter
LIGKRTNSRQPTALRYLGPGFVTGASDDDPAGIGTYIQAGAQFGYLQLWIALFSFPFMSVIQEMSGRIGLVTGQGLAAVIRNNYSRPVLLFIVTVQVVTNTINIGADLSAMAESAQLIFHIPYYLLLALTTSLATMLIVLVPYRRYAVYLKVLGLALLTYVISAFTVHVDWREVLTATFVPHFEWNKDFILTLIAVFGVTISPYEFFWQSSEEVEELVVEHKLDREEASRPQTTWFDVRFLRYDTLSGMFFSNVITFFVIITAAATLHAQGHTDVQSAAQAAAVLKPLAGNFTFILFTVGIVSAGLLAIPVMAGSSAYAVGGALNWSRTLSKPFWQEWRFYGIIVASCLIGLLVNALRVPPFKLLYWSAILNGVISPVLLFVVTQIAGNAKIMKEFTSSRPSSVMGWSLCAFMTLALVAFVV